MNIKGYISDYDGQTLTILAPFFDNFILAKRDISECEIRLDDGRTISADQRKKIYATLRDISLYTGHEAEELKYILKLDLIAQTGCEWFSLSNCSITQANEFLKHIIDFCILWDIPCEGNLLERSPDVSHYLYMCLANKKCAICGAKSDLHHIDAVGSGRNRKEIMHKGMSAISLCRIHHTEAHTIGKDTFCEKYHVYGIKLDDYLCQVLKLKPKELIK